MRKRASLKLAGELRSMFRILGKTDYSNTTIINYQEQIAETQTEQEEIRRTVEQLAYRRDDEASSKADVHVREMAKELRNIKGSISDLRSREQATAFDLEDSIQFVETLQERLKALSASENMTQILGSAQFKMCPVCFSATDTIDSDSICHLCKASISTSEPWVGQLKMREELSFQLRESKQLIGRREVDLANTRATLTSLAQRRRELELRLSAFDRAVHSVDAEMELYMQRIGYLDRLIEDLTGRAQLAALIEERISLRDRLNVEITSLKDELEAKWAAREKRSEEVKGKISELSVDVLRSDLPQEESFRNAETVEFDFGSNRIKANGRTRFSASSMTLLKNALITSLLRLSLEDEGMRWPRFLLLDNIEDKGMQPERSANFQELVAERLANVDVDNQVILTTSMISPTLDGSPYCVGPHYTHNEKALKFSSP